MDFGFSEEQRLLEDTIRRFLDESVPIAKVREVAETDAGFDATLWGELARLGVAGVIVPGDYGGSGLSLLDAAIIAESLGYGVVPAPFLSTSVLAPVGLLEGGTLSQKEEWLPRIATGDLRVGVAVNEVFSRREGAELSFEEGVLSGKALFVLDGPGADVLLVAAGSRDLLLVSGDAPGLTVERLSLLDRTRRVGEARFDHVDPVAVIGEPGRAGRAIERMLDAGRLVLAADTLGASERMLALAVEYAGQRRQFGRVIGSFQAVKHVLAELVAELEPARSLLWYAAYAFDSVQSEASLMASHAKAHLSEVGTAIAKGTTEVHGGIGFTDEQNLHLWFKRISVNRQLLGGPELLRERVASLQGWAEVD